MLVFDINVFVCIAALKWPKNVLALNRDPQSLRIMLTSYSVFHCNGSLIINQLIKLIINQAYSVLI